MSIWRLYKDTDGFSREKEGKNEKNTIILFSDRFVSLKFLKKYEREK